MKCNNCRAEIVEGMKFCNTCGTPVSKSENCVSSGAESSQKNKFCENCGEKIEDGMKFCSTCGAPISQITVDNSNVTDNYINNQNAEELEEDAMEKSENFIWKCGSYQIEFYEREVPDSDFPDYIGYVDNRYIIIPWYYDRHEFGNFDALRCSVDDDEEYNESYCFKNYVVPYILNGKQISIESVDVQSAPDWEDRFNQLFDEEYYDDDDDEYELKFFEFNLWEEDTSCFIFYGNHYALPIKQMLEGRVFDYGYINKIPECFEDYYEEYELEIDEFNDYLRCQDFDSNWLYLLDKDGNRITSVKDFDHSEPDEEGNIYYPAPKTDCIEEDCEYGLTPEAIIKWKEKFFNITFDIIEEDFVMENTKLLHYKGKSSKVIIPDSVTEIGEYAFLSCSSLSSITIPDSVTKIGNGAFSRCSSLSSITIPDSVTEIGDSAFSKCSSLSRITIPDSVTKIGEWAFFSCSSLSSITIPDSVTEIGNGAFSKCSSLSSITIPDSVTEIRYNAFSECNSLSSITIPDSVTEIGNSAFSECSSLSSIIIPDSVTEIRSRTFNRCSSLRSITIPDSVTKIGYSAFSKCSSLSSIIIPDSVTEIGNSAFSECSSLSSITIPDSVTKIGKSAFCWCESLKEISIPKDCEVDERAFDNGINIIRR